MTGLSNDIRDLATDYVLGLMAQGEVHLFEEIIARDAELATQVGKLRDRLLPLDLSAKPRDLPEWFVARTQAALKQPDTHNTIARAQDTTVPAPANSPRMPVGMMTGVIAAALVGIAVGFGAG